MLRSCRHAKLYEQLQSQFPLVGPSRVAPDACTQTMDSWIPFLDVLMERSKPCLHFPIPWRSVWDAMPNPSLLPLQSLIYSVGACSQVRGFSRGSKVRATPRAACLKLSASCSILGVVVHKDPTQYRDSSKESPFLLVWAPTPEVQDRAARPW